MISKSKIVKRSLEFDIYLNFSLLCFTKKSEKSKTIN